MSIHAWIDPNSNVLSSVILAPSLKRLAKFSVKFFEIWRNPHTLFSDSAYCPSSALEYSTWSRIFQNILNFIWHLKLLYSNIIPNTLNSIPTSTVFYKNFYFYSESEVLTIHMYKLSYKNLWKLFDFNIVGSNFENKLLFWIDKTWTKLFIKVR